MMSMSSDQRERLRTTARLCALVRARETRRVLPRVVDPFAERFVQREQGDELVRQLSRVRHYQCIHDGLVVRTRVMDELLREVVWEQGVRTILNLGAGFDTRPYRLDLPADCTWIEADLAEVLREKHEVLARECPTCKLVPVRLDLADPAARQEVLAVVAQAPAPAAVLTEGVLLYLPASEVHALADDLARQPTICTWLLDLGSPRATANLTRWYGAALPALSARGGPSARFFTPEAGTDSFAASGWVPAQIRSFILEAHRLRALSPWMWWGYRFVERWGTPEQAARLRSAVQVAMLTRGQERDGARRAHRLQCSGAQ